MPNPYGLPVYLVRLKGQREYEQQPATSVEDAARKFIHYAEITKGVVEVLAPDKDRDLDLPVEYPVRGNPRVTIK